ncbi:MAG: hypothetical protein QG588_1985, partial [Candidatus Poribacteria bacterium]|nr:hypothetical protein [Candidatus Poribacteria bacterium]
MGGLFVSELYHFKTNSYYYLPLYLLTMSSKVTDSKY